MAARPRSATKLMVTARHPQTAMMVALGIGVVLGTVPRITVAMAARRECFAIDSADPFGKVRPMEEM